MLTPLSNTDRMLAVWQSLHPDSYVTNHTNVLATFTTPPRSWADENTPLHPFHRNEVGDFWTSTLVRDHTVFGYTYPELVGLTDNATLVRRVNALYGENATSQFSWDQKQGYDIPPAQSTSTNVLNAPKPTPISSLSSQSAQRLDVQYHYFANIRTPDSQTTGAYKVFVFFDAVRTASESPDTMLWMHDPGLVGFAGFPGKGSMAGEDAHEANSVVALTRALEERVKTGELASMDGDAVAAYLRAHLSWRAEPTVDVEVEVTGAAFPPPRPDAFPLLRPGGVRRLFDE
jgi:tyrosinase